MKHRIVLLLQSIFRGYGQMFLCGSVRAGIIFLIGLILLSPMLALWSFIGAIVVTLTGWLLSRDASLLSSGLFGVNGVLLGSFWGYHPEVEIWMQGVLTIVGSVIMALVLVPTTLWMKRMKSPYVLFSLSYVFTAWTCLALLRWQGVYDPRVDMGWHVIAEGNAVETRASSSLFENTKLKTAHAKALALDGLGWIKLFKGTAVSTLESRQAFEEALRLDPSLADAHDGLGWAYLMKDDAAALAHFRKVLELNPWLADSWHGMGWAYYRAKDYEAMLKVNTEAVKCAPLFVPAHYGREDALHRIKAKGSNFWSEDFGLLVENNIARKFWMLPSGQIACWILFALGVLSHSRVSFVMLIAALSGCWVFAKLYPDYATALLDVSLVMNLIVIAIACGGLYVQRSFIGVLWLLLICVLMGWCWSEFSDSLILNGTPLLSLPCNIALLLGIAFFDILRRLKICDHTVPLELAVTSPENVCLWSKKAAVANACWKRLKKRKGALKCQASSPLKQPLF